MAKISARVEGLDAFKKGLKRYAEMLEKDADTQMKETTNAIATSAKGRAKSESVASTIQASKTEDGYAVTTQGEISAYLEFGTGNYAKALLSTYPKDWTDMARRFFISGAGRMPAQPYLYPSYQEKKQAFINDLKKAIERH